MAGKDDSCAGIRVWLQSFIFLLLIFIKLFIQVNISLNPLIEQTVAIMFGPQFKNFLLEYQCCYINNNTSRYDQQLVSF